MLLLPTFSFEYDPPEVTPGLLLIHDVFLPNILSNVSVIYLDLIFLRSNTRPMNCYVIFKGWLFLSLPFGCFSIKTTFTTLSIYLWTLTLVWVVSLSEMELTPHSLLPDSTM